MKESDWKAFCKIKQAAIEKYCTQQLDQVEQVITNYGVPASDRLFYIRMNSKHIEQEMRQLFDGHSRSQAPQQLMLMRRADLVTQAQLELLSSEFQLASLPS